MADALRNWRVRGPGRRALNPISPKAREAGPRKPGPGSGPPRFAPSRASRARVPPSRLTHVASYVSFPLPGPGPAGLLSPAPPPSPPRARARAPALSSGCRRTQGFDVPNPAPHPVRFYVTFHRFSNLSSIGACALMRPPFVPMATGPSPTLLMRLFLPVAWTSGLGWREVQGRPQGLLNLHPTPHPPRPHAGAS